MELSVEWFIEQLEQKGDMIETPYIRNLQLNIDTSDYLELKRQAKELEKQNIINAWESGEESEYQYHINSEYRSSAEQYYAENYGGSGAFKNEGGVLNGGSGVLNNDETNGNNVEKVPNVAEEEIKEGTYDHLESKGRARGKH